MMLFSLALLLLLTPFPSLQTTTNEKRNSTESDKPKPNVVLTLSKPKILTTTKEKRNSTVSDQPKPNVVLTFSKTKILTTTNEKKNSTVSDQPKPNVVLTLSKTKILTTTNEKKNSTESDKPKPNVLLTLSKPQIPTTTKEKRNATESDKPKPNVVLTLLKPKIPVVKPAVKLTVKPTPKPSAVNQTLTTPTKPPTGTGPKVSKDKPSPTPPPPIKVVISSSEGCLQRASSNHTKEQATELQLKPGSPLVMTHHISLLPGSCTGACVAEMEALKGRVARLEKEMSSIKDKCPCSKGQCPNDCSSQGKCDKGKCSCLPGFLGADCSIKGSKDKVQITVETVSLKVSPGTNITKESIQKKTETVSLKVSPGTNITKESIQKKTETVSLKVSPGMNITKESIQKKTDDKEQKTVTASKEGETKTKTKVTTNVKAVLTKTQAKQGVTVTKTTIKGSTRSNANKVALGRPTVGQVLLKHHGGRKQEEARKGKTVLTVLTPKKHIKPDQKVKVTEESTGKANAKSVQLKDQPLNPNITTITSITVKKSNGTKVLIHLKKDTHTSANKTLSGKETLEQSTLAEKNATQTSGKKTIKKVKLVQDNVNATKVTLIVDSTKIGSGKTSTGKGKIASQYLVNVTIVETTSEVKVKTQSFKNATKKAGGNGLGSVKIQNITSYGFTLTWSAPPAMFKNFTVARREYRAEVEEDEEEEEAEDVALGGDDNRATLGNTTEVLRQDESTNGTITKAPVSSKADGKPIKRTSTVLPGSVRSVDFSNLRPQTRYGLYIFGTSPGKRSKIHRVTVMTGPEPPTELVFSNVTESSLSVSWSKPKTSLTGFKVTYTHSVTGASSSVSVDSQQSHVTLSKLSSGASYEVRVTVTLGRAESDALVAVITTVPAPPTRLQAINITDTKALLQWTPGLGTVDRFTLSYDSAKTPNVTVTVMVSGSSVEYQLRGLQRATLYTVRVFSQKGSVQSAAGITTTFTTASAVKASEVASRSAAVSWKAPSVAFHSYRLTYQIIGAEETKEVILESTVTEYKLTGLIAMSKYFVLVEGEREGQYTPVVTTEFTTGKLRFPFPTECSQELLNGALQSGEVEVYPAGRQGCALKVYCDMETDGGGWTVFQRRMNGKTDFYRTWSDYTNGFGNLSGEFWLGNELLHNLSSLGPVSLRVDLASGNATAYAHYSNFTIASEAKLYAIQVSGYSGTAGDSMRYHNGRPFSTRDKDPNPLGIHCARAYMGGWWYKNCYKTNLNGLYGINSNNQGVVWIDWKGKDYSIGFTEMKFRPAGFAPTPHG